MKAKVLDLISFSYWSIRIREALLSEGLEKNLFCSRSNIEQVYGSHAAMEIVSYSTGYREGCSDIWISIWK